VRARLFGFAVLALACGAYLASALTWRTSIVDFLPHDEQSELLQVARDLSSAPQSRALVLTLSAPSDEGHRAAARALAEALRASGLLRWVRGGLRQGEQEAFYELFFPARLGLSELVRPGETRVSDALLAERVGALQHGLASPLGALLRETAPADPLGLFDAFVTRQARAQGELVQVDGQLVTRDGRWSVLFAETKVAAFDVRGQQRLSALLERQLARLRALQPGLVLEWSGVGRFAQAVEHSIRVDIERVSSFSLLGIVLLYVAVFRGLRQSLLVLVPIAFGSLLALALCQLLFGFVHGLSLAFGSAVIGAAEDFSTHFFAHRLESQPSEDNESLMRRLWPAMALGGFTSVVGVLSLLASGFPGLVQMAVFGAAGILGALLCTRYVLPALAGRPAPARAPDRARSALLALLARRPLWGAPLVLVPLLLMALGLPRLQFQDGIAALRTRTPALDAENARVQARLGRAAQAGRVIVASGADDEQALRRAELVAQRLAAAGPAAGFSYRSASGLLPSGAEQRRRQTLLRDDPSLLPRLRQTLAQQGFVPEAFEPFAAALAAPPVLLTPEQLLRSPLADLLAPFRARLGQRVAYLTPIAGGDGKALAALLSGIEGVAYVDQEALFSAAYARFRERALSLLGWGLGLVLLCLLARYRKPLAALLGMLPALLGAGAALGVLGLFGVPVSFMNVIGLLLVVSMGVDYGIYSLEGGEGEAATTLGSVLLAALTTVLSFGTLGLSDNPALASIGTTVGLGLLFCVSTSPLVLVFARRRSR
jgi:predicted exporter